jgi:AcrR family transcriptional regulator
MARRARRTKPPDSLLAPRREPDFRQARSRRSYLALLDAATELFAKLGYDAAGTPEIASKARVSVGTFYRYFDDKHDIYLEVIRRWLTMGYEETLARIVPDELRGRARRDTIAATIATLFTNVLAHPQLTRSFMEMSLRDEAVGEIRRAIDELGRQRIAALITAIAPRDVVPDPGATAYVIYGAAMQCAYGLAIHLGPPPIDRERAKAALAMVIERALIA